MPGAADAVAVIDVAGSSLENDRGKKLALYARAGIAQYVIVNLRDACVALYELRAGEMLKLRTAEAPLEIDVSRILP